MPALIYPDEVRLAARPIPRRDVYLPLIGVTLEFDGPFPPLLGLGALYAYHWKTSHRIGLSVLVSVDPGPHGDLYHLSISHRSRYPRWDEVHAARDALLPADKNFAMILPREGFYVNVDRNCFQIHELPAVLDWD